MGNGNSKDWPIECLHFPPEKGMGNVPTPHPGSSSNESAWSGREQALS
jgi:hypothetical protein